MNKIQARASAEICIANCRGPARAYGKKYALEIDSWAGMLFHALTPEEYRHINLLFYASGADMIFSEAFHIVREGEKIGPNKFGVSYFDFARHARTHPRRGKQIVKLGIIRGLGDFGLGGLHGGVIADEEWRRDFTWPTEEKHDKEKMIDYNLVDVFFPEFGSYGYSNWDRWGTGTPYGPLDMIPWDTPLEHLKTFDLLMYFGVNGMDRRQYENIRRYVEQGGVLVISLGQLRIPDGEPRKLIDADLQSFLGVDVKEDRKGLPISIEGEKSIYFEVEGNEKQGKAKSIYRVNPVGCEVKAETEDGEVVVTEKNYGGGKVYFYATEFISSVSEELNKHFVSSIAEKAKLFSLEPRSDWIEYTIQRKAGTFIFNFFNHGRMKFPCGNGKDHGIWEGKMVIDVKRLGYQKDQKLEAYVVEFENPEFTLMPVNIHKKGDTVMLNLKIDKRTELIIGPKEKTERQFFYGKGGKK